jgi:hypothetical protein
MKRPQGVLANNVLDLEDRIRELSKVVGLAIKIIDTNLYHQREKVADASALLKQALNPPF